MNENSDTYVLDVPIPAFGLYEDITKRQAREVRFVSFDLCNDTTTTTTTTTGSEKVVGQL